VAALDRPIERNIRLATVRGVLIRQRRKRGKKNSMGFRKSQGSDTVKLLELSEPRATKTSLSGGGIESRGATRSEKEGKTKQEGERIETREKTTVRLRWKLEQGGAA